MRKIITLTKMMVIALMAAMTFSSCEQDDSYDAETLVAGYWQGYLGVYYQNRWSVSGKSYATEMHFRHNGSYYTSGRGYEVDYDTRNPHVNYAYCTFKWFIVDGEITLIYDDDLWSPVYITDYSLSSSHFYGYIYDGSNRNIKFDFENVATSDWDGRGYEYGRYGDFDYDYYSRRTRGSGEAVADSIPVQDRTLLCNNQEEGARSILSGTFARK